jgi:hypothetical protein
MTWRTRVALRAYCERTLSALDDTERTAIMRDPDSPRR